MLPPCARRRCVSLAAFCLIVTYKVRVESRDTETMGRIITQRFRPTRPPGRSGPMDRTAGGIGGAAPASLDLYGQSRTKHFLWRHQDSGHMAQGLQFELEGNRLSLKSGENSGKKASKFLPRSAYHLIQAPIHLLTLHTNSETTLSPPESRPPGFRQPVKFELHLNPLIALGLGFQLVNEINRISCGISSKYTPLMIISRNNCAIIRV